MEGGSDATIRLDPTLLNLCTASALKQVHGDWTPP
jgi:hypothetical protein